MQRSSSDNTTAKEPARERFHHESLSTEPQEIRLFQLHPHLSEDGHLQGAIKHFTLDCPTSYMAVSYCWGSPAPAADILLDGQPLSIRMNLYHFLQTMRQECLKDLDGWFWIDQICIDQANVVERNHQVQNMQTIYQRADMVYAWVGAASEDSDRALEIVRDFQGHIARPTSSRSGMIDPLDWEALTRFFSRPYWKRLWVVQEIVLAKKVIFGCGTQTIGWEALHNIVLFLKDIGNADQLIRSRAFSSGYPKFALWLAIAEFSGHDCEDPRDKVYGL